MRRVEPEERKPGRGKNQWQLRYFQQGKSIIIFDGVSRGLRMSDSLECVHTYIYTRTHTQARRCGKKQYYPTCQVKQNGDDTYMAFLQRHIYFQKRGEKQREKQKERGKKTNKKKTINYYFSLPLLSPLSLLSLLSLLLLSLLIQQLLE